MSDEQRARFSEWWNNHYTRTCRMFSTGGDIWFRYDGPEEIAWQAWQAAAAAGDCDSEERRRFVTEIVERQFRQREVETRED